VRYGAVEFDCWIFGSIPLDLFIWCFVGGIFGFRCAPEGV
jgi:hypothetical protein